MKQNFWSLVYSGFLAASLFGTCSVPPVLAESVSFPEHFDPAPISAAYRDAFFEAFTSGRPLTLPLEVSVEPEADPALRSVWLGNEPELKGAIDTLQLLFEAPPETEGAAPDSFQLSVEFREDSSQPVVVLKTSRPSVSGTEGGVLMFLTGDKVRRTLVRGQRKASVVVALPETRSDAVKGVLVCPLDPIHSSDREILNGLKPDMRATGFRPVSARVEAEGMVKGKFLSGLSRGFARANISTSAAIPNTHLHFDETASKDPHVDVTFQGDGLSDPIPFTAEGTLRQGISMQLMMQNSGGYTRFTKLTITLEVAPVERPFDFSVLAMRREFKVNSSSCFSVLIASELREEYSKVEVKAP
ncbi:MAG: hypothetical protein J0M12_03785 [Deltaproteobacteria bacterium]|nr:hypothetical protein [Deltaproteobacteria bacterium]